MRRKFHVPIATGADLEEEKSKDEHKNINILLSKLEKFIIDSVFLEKCFSSVRNISYRNISNKLFFDHICDRTTYVIEK